MTSPKRARWQMKAEYTDYGFRWGDVLVERIASNEKKPKFQVLRIHTLNGDCIEILIRPRSNKVSIHPNPELKRKLKGDGG